MLQLKKKSELTNKRPANESQLVPEVICKAPAGKLSITQAGMELVGVAVGDRILIEDFGDKVYAVRKSPDDRGALIDDNGNFSAGAAWQALGGVREAGEDKFYSVYGIEEGQEAEVDNEETAIVFVLTQKEEREAPKRIASDKSEETTTTDENVSGEGQAKKKGKKRAEEVEG